MKKPDKFLLGIVVGVVLLVGAAFALVLTRPAPTYQPETTPEGVVYNYLLAIQNQDYARAYGYLDPTMLGYPTTLADFQDELDRGWGLDLAESTTRLLPEQTSITEAQARVTLEIRQLGSGGPFGGDRLTTQVFTLQHNAATWQIREANGSYLWYWQWGSN